MPEIPDRYVVHWTPSCPRDDAGELDIERREMAVKVFARFDPAVRHALGVLRGRKDIFGSVELTKERAWKTEDGIVMWDDVASLFVDDPEVVYTERDMQYVYQPD